MLGVRLEADLETRLENLAQRTHRSKSYHAKEALKLYIEREEIKEKRDQQSIERWEQFQEDDDSIANDSVINWLDSWGAEQEKPCPKT